MATKLEKALKRELQVGETAYMLTIDPQGLKLVVKGKRKSRQIAREAPVSPLSTSCTAGTCRTSRHARGRLSHAARA